MSNKKLGFGLMRLPLLDKNDAGSIDMEKLCEMVDAFLDSGFTYFDTAYMYCGGKSESAVKEALTLRHKRDEFTVTSKLPAYKLKCHEDRDAVFFEQLSRTGLEYFDYYFLHNVNSKSYPVYNEYDCFSWLSDKKAKGLTKKIGFSFHDSPELLDEVLTLHPEIDVVQLQLNYLDWENAGVQSKKCYEVATKHKKPVIVMEPVRGGMLATVPKEVEELFHSMDEKMSVPSFAIRFAASLDNVMLVLSGMSNMEQLLDNMGYMENFVPFTHDEFEKVTEAGRIIAKNKTIPCTACEYCIVECPKNIAIPKYFALYNLDMLEEDPNNAETMQKIYYRFFSASFGKASDCISCGKCESMCPQRIEIRQLLKKMAEHFEKDEKS